MRYKLYARLGELMHPAERERGEGPVPYIILVALIGALAVTLYWALDGVVGQWVGKIPTNK
ncbi:MAG: hypothetical protein HOU81_15490 [Hamadaea sp.]|uniref:hypothetical protein n=1 Tax=Hamadaea sp. TaxID=2024425 RepID=UPI0017999484|nr:hypothetical protein [Hamadaea sp.]NUR72216.1 hypothetical protein [Hamadaea sp.]NUT22109.1 hypothetical protein [Hamadaea sp.]